jgi:hypothetical protein
MQTLLYIVRIHHEVGNNGCLQHKPSVLIQRAFASRSLMPSKSMHTYRIESAWWDIGHGHGQDFFSHDEAALSHGGHCKMSPDWLEHHLMQTVQIGGTCRTWLWSEPATCPGLNNWPCPRPGRHAPVVPVVSWTDVPSAARALDGLIIDTCACMWTHNEWAKNTDTC